MSSPLEPASGRAALMALVLVSGLTLACGESQAMLDLCAAVEMQDVEAVRTLVSHDSVDLNAGQQSGTGCRPFLEALERVQPDHLTKDRRGLAMVRVMLDRGADPNSCWVSRSGRSTQTGTIRRTSSSPTPMCVLEHAAHSQSPSLMQLLMERGANVKGGAGASALAAAAGAGALGVVKQLVEAGAPLNDVPPSSSDLGNDIPALGAAVNGLHDEVVAYLEEQPGAREFTAPGVLSGAASAASRVVSGHGGLTASEQAFMTAARRGDVAGLKAALSGGVLADRLDDYGQTALMRAAAWGRTEAVVALIQSGADVNLMNDAKTALHFAAARGHVGPIQALARAKADVNARYGPAEDSPLFAAVKGGHPAATRALLDLGADSSVADISLTVLEYAIWQANTPVVAELLRDGRTPVNMRHPSAQGSPLHGALWCKTQDHNISLIRTLIAAGADLTAVDQNGDTPLKAVERKRAAEKLPYYQGCYGAQLALLKGAVSG